MPAVADLQQQALKSNVQPVYDLSKEYICCTLADEAYNIWVAWTVAGCLGVVLAAMCGGRIVHRAVSLQDVKVGWQVVVMGDWAAAVCLLLRSRMLDFDTAPLGCCSVGRHHGPARRRRLLWCSLPPPPL